jgi:hypothetical protein
MAQGRQICRTGWKKQCVKHPDCVRCYNEGMFGVDKSNQYLSRYPCYIKSKFHWWKVYFSILLIL